MSEKNLTRRNFLEAAAATGATAALVGCSSSDDGDGSGGSAATSTASITVPDASEYPIDAEEWGSGTVLWTEEEMRDGWTKVANESGTTIGIMDTDKLIQVSGFAFKDLNGNGKLDFWEDWRQGADDRAAALAAELSSDEAVALMLHGSIYSASTDMEEAFEGSYFDIGEGDPNNMHETLEYGIRTILQFMNSGASSELAQWTNALQEVAEEQTYGIPVNISNNPKDYGFPSNLGLAATFDPELVQEVAEAESKCYRAEGVTTLLGPQMDITSEPRWSRIGSTFGEDPALSRDLTNAYTTGLQSTYDEDGNDLGWGMESVNGMIKHFPGDGPGESGRESHNDYGKFCVYPNDNFATSLIPFIDGGLHLDSSTGETAAFMTSYSIAYSDTEEYGELVGSGFSKYKIDLLRENCAYDGLICTDWGVTEDLGGMICTPWGMEDSDKVSRMTKIIDAGADQIGGGFDLAKIKEAYAVYAEEVGEDAALERVQASARRVLKTFYTVGLSDCPYVDSTAANSVTTDEGLVAFAADVTDKSVVMLKNSGNVIASASGTPTVYIPLSFTAASTSSWTGATTPSSWDLPVTEEAASALFTVVTDNLGDPTGEADDDGNAMYAETDVVRLTADDLGDVDYALVFISNPSTGAGYDSETGTYIPISLQYSEYVADGENVRTESIGGDVVDGVKENRSYYGQSTVATNLSDMELVQNTKALIGDTPLVVCINTTNPVVLSEIEPYADAILMVFEGSNDDFLNIASGSVEPSGLLPLQMPASMDTVEANAEDTPRDLECYQDADGNVYDFAFGLNWSGVISDDRTATYAVEVLTTPENITL